METFCYCDSNSFELLFCFVLFFSLPAFLDTGPPRGNRHEWHSGPMQGTFPTQSHNRYRLAIPPGSMTPTLFEPWCGFFKNRPVKVLWDGTYDFSSLSEKTRKSNDLQISLQRQHFLSYLKTLSVGEARVFDSAYDSDSFFFFLLGYKHFYTFGYNSITSENKSFLKITYMGLWRNVLNETARVEILSRMWMMPLFISIYGLTLIFFTQTILKYKMHPCLGCFQYCWSLQYPGSMTQLATELPGTQINARVVLRPVLYFKFWS